MRTWVDVAVLAKSRNLDGRFVARAAAGLPFLLEEGDSVSLVPPKLDVPRAVTVSHVVLLDDERAEISFEEVSDAEIASELVGMHCHIKRDLIDAESFEEAPALWEGWPVVDISLGEIGTLAGVVENTAQTLLEVDRNGSIVLIPLVDEIVTEIDVDGERIHVNLPKGLLEL
ncbi:MAG: 16S rRNA processing protein RimM [Eggerthellaceae bacterium]|nr:16S rRNA processing protein RimM [Eggerthellaceae bacterium]